MFDFGNDHVFHCYSVIAKIGEELDMEKTMSTCLQMNLHSYTLKNISMDLVLCTSHFIVALDKPIHYTSNEI